MTSGPGTAARPEPGSSSCTELITPEPAQALAALLDIDAPDTDEGLPALWHWIYLLERRRQADLGPDGHPTYGIPAPPGPGRLRMFAGGRVLMLTPLRFGEPGTRTTRVVSTAEKEGRSGRLTFVTVRTKIEQGGAQAIVDEQDIVYREATAAVPRARPPAGDDVSTEPPQETGKLAMTVDPTVLFRFSALTYNAHRIHYDQAYAAAEGYPDLVVHGPLQALLMGECLRRSGVSMLGGQFAYRLVAPTYGAQRLAVSFSMDGRGHSARVRDGAGRTTATATLQSLVEPSSPRNSDTGRPPRSKRPHMP
jgi:3-methylfumaryl-CoA hydratase